MDPDVQEVPVHIEQRGRPRSNMHAPDVIVVDDGNPAGADQGRLPLDNLERALETACTTLNNISETVMNFSFDSQHDLFSKMNEFVRDLKEVDRCSKDVTAAIPADVIEYIDKGRNPEVCTAHMLEAAAEANNVTIGKLNAVDHFRDELEKSLREAREQGKLQPLAKDDLIANNVAEMDVDTDVPKPPSVNPSNGF